MSDKLSVIADMPNFASGFRRHKGKSIPDKPAPEVMRRPYRLTLDEFRELAHLRSWPEGVAYLFWKAVAAARGLDYRTIIGDTRDHECFTALPEGHGKHWCWPMELRCKEAPANFVGIERLMA